MKAKQLVPAARPSCSPFLAATGSATIEHRCVGAPMTENHAQQPEKWGECRMKPDEIVDRAARILPYELRKTLGYPYKKYMFSRYLKKVAGARYKTLDLGPMPPPELITAEVLIYEDDLKIEGKPASYFGSGFRDAWIILTTFDTYSFDLRSVQSVLEFGRGTGRVLRHFRNIRDLRLTGTDANPKPIEWDRENLPNIEFYHNGLTPPLTFRAESFDLIYALSVFTHIPIDLQRSWLDELRRVLVPSGYLLCTVSDPDDAPLSIEEREQLERDGALTFDRNHPRASYSTQVLGSWDVWQKRDQIRAVFSRVFEMLCYTSEPAVSGQPTLVLRKAGSLT
jgi:SAM-dependent methyltransferase